MNSVAYYPRDSITFKRELEIIAPEVRRWKKPLIEQPDVISEGNSEADWLAWDRAEEEAAHA